MVNRSIKQVIIIRQDLKMSTGKKVAQGCHAAILSYDIARQMVPSTVMAWKREGQKKVALKVPDEPTLLSLYDKAKRLGIPCSIIRDAGLTELEPGTITAVGIGPDKAEKIDEVTGNLKLL